MTSFAEWVRATRRAKNLTLVEVANRAGVKQPVWSSWEKGDQTPRRETVIKIATALAEPIETALLLAGYLPTAGRIETDLITIEQMLLQMPEDRRPKAVDAMRRIAETFLTVA